LTWAPSRDDPHFHVPIRCIPHFVTTTTIIIIIITTTITVAIVTITVR
jgi:hypothetical protein